MNAKYWILAALFTVIVWCGLVPVACGASLYWDAVAGDDAAAGTISAPLKTLAKMSRSTFNPDDFIYFKSGQMFSGADTSLTMPSSGTSGHPITFGVYGGTDKATIDNSKVVPVGYGWRLYSANIYYNVIQRLAANDSVALGVWLSGVVATKREATKAGLDANREWCRLRAAVAAEDTLWIYITSAADTTGVCISKNSLSNNNKSYLNINDIVFKKAYGSYIYGTAGTFNTYNRVWFDSCYTQTNGIGGQATTSFTMNSCVIIGQRAYKGHRLHIVVFNNCVFISPSGTQSTVFADSSDTKPIFNNCIFYHAGDKEPFLKYARKSDTAPYWTGSNNIFYRAGAPTGANAQIYYWNGAAYTSKLDTTLVQLQADGGETGSYVGDPKFVSVALSDFSLQQFSPARDTGKTVGLTIDFAGNPVPMPETRPPDIGAYEYQLYNSRKLIITSKRPRM